MQYMKKQSVKQEVGSLVLYCDVTERFRTKTNVTSLFNADCYISQFRRTSAFAKFQLGEMNLNCSKFTSELLNKRSLPTCKVKDSRRRVTRRPKTLVSWNHLDCAAIRKLTLAVAKYSLRSDVSSSNPICSTPARQNISRRRLFLSQKQQKPRCSRGVTLTSEEQTTFRDVVEGLDRNQLNHLGKLFKNGLDENDNDDETKTKFLYQVMAYIASLAFLGQRKPDEIPRKLDDKEAGYEEIFSDGTTVRYFNREEQKKCISHVIKIQLDTTSNTTDKQELTIDGLTNPFVVIQHGQSITQRIPWKKNDDSWSSVQYLLVKSRKDSIQKDPKIKSYLYLFDGGSSQGTSGSSINSLEELRRLHEVVLTAEIDVNLTDGETAKTHTIELHVGKQGHKDSKIEVKKLLFTTEILDFKSYIDEPKDNDNLDERSHVKNPGPIPFQIPSIPSFLSPPPPPPPPSVSQKDQAHLIDTKAEWKTWKELLESKGKPNNPLYLVAYVDVAPSMTQTWIYGNLKEKILVLNFPATDAGQWKDMVTNFEWHLKPLGKIVEHDSNLDSKNVSKNSKIHQGYKEAYLSIQDILRNILDAICEWNDDWLIITTGHSLGGSVASLAAYDIANRRVKGTQPHVAMFAYGPPSVGNEAFYDSFQKSVPLGFHMVAHNDKIANSIFSGLERVGKAFPMNPTDKTSITHVLDATVKGNLSSSSDDDENEENMVQSQNLETIRGLLAHLESHYFEVISAFMKSVFPSTVTP